MDRQCPNRSKEANRVFHCERICSRGTLTPGMEATARSVESTLNSIAVRWSAPTRAVDQVKVFRVCFPAVKR
jgi:hypothetical protein